MADSGQPCAPAASPASSDIDISTPAVAAWGSSEFLSDVIFDARHLKSTNEAFLKLRSTVTLKASARTKTPFFVFIHPERIELLQTDALEADVAEQTTQAEAAAKKLAPDVVCLRFVLAKAADLVGPKAADLAPKNQASGAVLDSLRSLAHQDSFAVYFPRNVLSHARLSTLCDALSGGRLKSIAHQADLASLYKGKGGQVISEPDTPRDGATTASWNSPPSYDELGPGPPVAPLDSPLCPSKKRRLSSSDDVASTRLDPLDVERLCRKIVDEQKAEMIRVVEEQQSKLYERLLAELKPHIDDRMELMEHRILDHIDRRAGKLAEEQNDHLEERVEEVQDHCNDIMENRVLEVDEKVEGEFYGLRLRLEEYIQEEMAEAEERIVENLQNSVSVSLQFSTS